MRVSEQRLPIEQQYILDVPLALPVPNLLDLVQPIGRQNMMLNILQLCICTMRGNAVVIMMLSIGSVVTLTSSLGTFMFHSLGHHYTCWNKFQRKLHRKKSKNDSYNFCWIQRGRHSGLTREDSGAAATFLNCFVSTAIRFNEYSALANRTRCEVYPHYFPTEFTVWTATFFYIYDIWILSMKVLGAHLLTILLRHDNICSLVMSSSSQLLLIHLKIIGMTNLMVRHCT